MRLENSEVETVVSGDSASVVGHHDHMAGAVIGARDPTWTAAAAVSAHLARYGTGEPKAR